mgnify:FL=1
MKQLFLLCLIMVSTSLFSQNTKKEKVKYTYTQLPMDPLPESVTSYSSTIVIGYAEEEAEKARKYEEDKKDAEEAYAQERKEYKNKSLGKKVLETALLGKAPPEARIVEKPTFKPTYNTEALANTYLKLEGYEKGNENSVLYEVTLGGLRATDPVIKNSSLKNKDGTTTYEFWYEVVYTYPMAVRLEADGEEILNETYEAFETEKLYQTRKFKSDRALRKALPVNTVMQTVDNKAFKENMSYTNLQINETYAFMAKKRKTVVYTAKGKKHDYTDLTKAYIAVEQGLVDYDANGENAEIKTAIAIWNSALEEMDLENKKARINRKVAFGLHLNQIEYNILINDYTAAKTAINNILLMNPSKAEDKKFEPYRDFFEDMRDRYDANNED